MWEEGGRGRRMTESEKNRRIKDLLYLNKVITDIITTEIEECVMRGKSSNNEEIKEHILYHIDEQLRL